MTDTFSSAYAALKEVFSPYRNALRVTSDSPDSHNGFYLVGTVPSPFKQHKGGPIFFGSVRVGKAYVSFHLMPLYMNPELTASISPALKKRMQGKTCFNFRSTPDATHLAELSRLTEAGFQVFRAKHWI